MTQRTWNGSTGLFSDGTLWTPNGAPVDGDTAIINAGTVTESGFLPAAFLLQLNGGNTSPTLNLIDTTIVAGSHLAITASGANATAMFSGTAANQGSIDLAGSPGGTAVVQFDGSTTTTLTNSGGMTIAGTAATLQAIGSGGSAQLVNNGIISIRNGTGTSSLLTADLVAIGGTGSIRLGANVTLEVAQAIGSGQTIVFEPGTAAAATLAFDGPSLLAGSISGFSVPDTITAFSGVYDSYAYVSTGTSTGTLQFTSAGTVINSLAFNGSYTTADFTVSSQVGSGLEESTIKTTVPQVAQTIAYTDIVTNISASDTVLPYSDPNVPYLQYTYQWSSADPVAIRATVPNVFLHGGAGGDALQAFGGQNVLDGGGGSNFLIGATGSDGGSDVFFVDGRNQVNTWSTIVNFHQNDIAVIFGFKQGISTAPWVASDGAAGYTGATLHSELNGAGTGVNESMTFTGVSLATEAGFQVSYGSAAAQGNDYIMIKYV